MRLMLPVLTGEMPHSGTGTAATLNSITRQDIDEYYRGHLNSRAATLVIVGRMGRIEAEALLNTTLQLSTASTLPAIRTVGRSSPKAQIIVLNKPGQQQSAVFALHLAPPKRGPNDAAINLAVQIIGGPSGRIKRNLRSSKGWSYGAGSFLAAMNGERLLATGGPVQANKTIEAMREIARELREFATSRLPTANEVSAAIHELPRANPVFIEPYEILTKLVREVVMFDLKPDYIGSYITDVRRLTPADIGRAATVLF